MDVIATGAAAGGGPLVNVFTGSGPGGRAHVRIGNTAAQTWDDFFAYDPEFLGGVYVAGW